MTRTPDIARIDTTYDHGPVLIVRPVDGDDIRIPLTLSEACALARHLVGAVGVAHRPDHDRTHESRSPAQIDQEPAA